MSKRILVVEDRPQWDHARCMWGRISRPDRQVWPVASVAATLQFGRYWGRSGSPNPRLK